MNVIREAMAASRPTFGVALTWPDPGFAETIAAGGNLYERSDPDADRIGFDWAWLDTQHAGLTLDNLLPVMQGFELGGMQSVIRVGWNDPRLIMRALDLGASAVVVPMVSTAAEARAAAEAARYPPRGTRSFGPLRRGMSVDAANEEVVCLVMVETAEGVENLEEIAATPGVDGIFIGPMDLTISFGLEPSFAGFHPRVLEVFDRTVQVCERRGLIPGTITIGHESAEDLLERGMRLLIIGHDMTYVQAALGRDLDKIAEWSTRYRRGSADRSPTAP